MSPQAEAATARLRSTWEKWWTCSLFTGLLLAAAVSFGLLVLFVLSDAMWRHSQVVLGGLFALWAGVTVALAGLLIARLLRYRRSLEATARRVELAFPELGSHLINLVQLGEEDGELTGENDYRRAAVEQAAAAVSEFPFERAAEHESRWGRFWLCMQTPRDLIEAAGVLAVVLGVGGLLHAAMPAWSSSTKRLLHPWEFVPATGAVRIVSVTPGDADVLLGSSLEVRVEVAESLPKSSRATLYVRREGERETATAMMVGRDGKTCAATLAQVAGPLRYRVEVQDTQSALYRVGVYRKPAVAEVAVTYTFPAYLDRPPQTLTRQDGDLEAPQFTVAELRIVPTVPIAQGYLEQGGLRSFGRVVDEGRTLLAELLMRESSAYGIHLITRTGHKDDAPRRNQVKVLEDGAPTVRIVEPAREASVAGGGSFDVVLQAGDDYGLGEVRLELKRGGGSGETQEPSIETVASWTRFGGEGLLAQLHHRLTLEVEKYPAGVPLAIRAVARDRRLVDRPELKLGPRETATQWLAVRVVDPGERATSEMARVEDLRAAVAKILQQQVQARLGTAGLTKAASLEEGKQAAQAIRQQQVEVQKSTAIVAESPAAAGDDDETRVIRRVLQKLAFNEMLQAVREAEGLAGVEALDRMEQPTLKLKSTQDQVIDQLRRLLSELRRETAGLLAAMERRPETTVPPDVEDKLRALRDKLLEYLKQQKKVIEASENLAKKPVEDFTEEELKALEAMAATEDEWSKFLADQHSDLSKLPEQDFSNPSMLQEMIAVETEIKMAADALTKKAVDIAVPLEQLGAEMAEELTTNIEKWLPDSPDRERWSQEEPLTDEMKEAPMAELPQELEDLVGELMEEEEDLFDEMEDMTSSWADSLDKGAGWDALDGPISNMSARGVTGNRLPNTSEIGGRSGEGRSGKSSGEFVSDTAVGKGGRKTPTRLTPDAFVKGEVKDTSKDPVGGATGGGKMSGYGGEGLQGPVPDRPQNPLAKLAARQTELRNKAEAVDLKFQVLRFHHTDLKRLIGQMAAVEQDLRAGLYQNALRRREVILDDLGQVKTYLDGEFVIRQDRSANLPADIQKDLLGSMREVSPAGWEALNRRYFERLSGAVPSSGEPAAVEPTPVVLPSAGATGGDGG